MKSKLYILLTMFLACTMQVKGEVKTNVRTVTVGTGTQTHLGIGLCDYYKNYSAQILYTSQQIGMSGTITAMAFNVAEIPSDAKANNSTVKIYMSEVTDKTSLSTSNMEKDSTKMTLVFDGNIPTATSTGWQNIELTTPFVYTNTGNLLVTIECQRSEYSKVSYYCTSATGMSLYKYDDSSKSYSYAFVSTNMKDPTYIPNTQFTIIPEDNVASVGTGANNSPNIGLCDWYHYFSSQTLYTAQQVGKSGTITSIAYNVASVSNTATANNSTVRIYMSEVKQTSLTTENMEKDPNNMIKVFEGNIPTAVSVGWKTIPLTCPFEYIGKGNLLVAVECERSVASKANYTYTTTGMTLNKCSDSYSSYADAFSSTNMSTTYNYAPDIKFTFVTEEDVRSVENATSKTAACGLDVNFVYTSSQNLYTKAELGSSAGVISGLSVKVASYTGTEIDGDLEIYLGETSKSGFGTKESPAFLSKNEMTLVYSGTYKFGAVKNGWERINFHAPFKYSGKNNLVVAFSSKKSGYRNVIYYYTQQTGRRIAQRNDGDSNYANAFVNNSFDVTEYLPVMQFVFEETATFGTTTNYNYWSGFGCNNPQISSQNLYLNTDIKSAGNIKKIAFQIASNVTANKSQDLKLYMAEVPFRTLTTSTKMKVENMTQVYDGTISFKNGTTAGDWVEVPLDKHFTYTGCGNLLIAVHNIRTDATSYAFRADEISSRSLACSNNGPNVVNTEVGLPNILLTFATHKGGSNFSEDGFCICDNCKSELKYYFQMADILSTTSSTWDLGVSNAGQLMWLCNGLNKTTLTSSTGYNIYQMKDIDLSGYNWIPIGNDAYPLAYVKYFGYEKDSKQGHTIKGLAQNNFLFGKVTNGQLRSLRLESGKLIENAQGGAMSQCLTLGSALCGTKADIFGVDCCYYVASSANTNGGRTSAQMSNGQVTYELNQYEGKNKTTWYQTIGADAYPMVDPSRGVVYRYINNCVQSYTNDVSLNGTDTHAGPMENAICSNCKVEPTLFNVSVTLNDSMPYLRENDAEIKGSGNKLSYTRMFTSRNSSSGDNVGKWQPFCVPFSFNYTQELFDKFELAEVYAYGVNQDTNNDGDVTSADDKSLIACPLNVDAVTEPNMPYLIRVKGTGATTITITSNDGHLYKAENKSVTLETMKEKVVVTGNYQKKQYLVRDGLRWSRNGYIITPTNDTQYAAPFRWYAKLETKKSGVTFATRIPITTTEAQLYILADMENSSYTRSTATVVPDFCYIRDFTEQQVGNWQSFYVPFAITLDNSILNWAEFATIDGVETDGDADCIIVTKRQAGYTIPANTPCVIRVRNAGDFEFFGWNVTLEPALNRSLVFNANHKYTFTGVYEPFKDHSFTWYAIAKNDGVFHKASAKATLPAYRFYMTIDEGETLASEVRFGFMEVDDEETGIRTFDDDASASAIYSIDGRRAQSENLQPGIYVKNGKKFRIQ